MSQSIRACVDRPLPTQASLLLAAEPSGLSLPPGTVHAEPAPTALPEPDRILATLHLGHGVGVARYSGLLIAGAAAMAVGLRLQDDLGTGPGVLGFLRIAGSV
jgi:hypothetical protein